jgi:HJR/Mrr/RecB family endonuclease
MSRYSREELLKMNVSDVEAIETPEVSAARAKKIFELGEDRFLSQHIKKDGTIYDVEVSIQYRAENEGWFIVFIRDITERKFAERALSSIATNFAGLSGKEFFEAASKHIATEMGIDYVYVGELTDDKESVRVLGGFALDEAMGEMHI